MKTRNIQILMAAIAIPFLSQFTYAGDQSLIRLQNQSSNFLTMKQGRGSTETVSVQKIQFIGNKGVAEEGREGVTGETVTNIVDGVHFEPSVTATEKAVNPSLKFSASKLINRENPNFSVDFEFTANSELKTDKAEEMLKEYMFQGGNLNFNLGLSYVLTKGIPGLGIQASYNYSLLTTEELSTESAINEIDAEIGSLDLAFLYDFSGAKIKASYRDFNLISEAGENEFAKLIDGDEGLVIGLILPINQKADGTSDYLLKFERARSSKLKNGLFRVSLETSF